ncbi:TIGR01459 family HAD-type hydrolase [Roseinatronobacter monicus]|uniref:HAD superfamily hydrolase (TIGR01459 family) n=1 Tax=Roseinatronobacter monicus TaxID=393481 RepID=A0A543K350_9RHOB|nr:TIGR01459 family HAD-type hydrolase [Roseinatronobacter monicus]TQM89523.1 HAD superfamily hydrolase (TIGR01459 family) [Roseinatronobacter monicus]
MVARIDSLLDIAPRFDAIVLDQWGVLHDGTTPYPGAIHALSELRQSGVRLAVLSNSGKRAEPNSCRIAGMGFSPDLFDLIMTSGEALWRDIHSDAVPERVFCPVEAAVGDARRWAEGLDIMLVDDPSHAQAMLLMGLPDQVSPRAATLMQDALRRGLPVYCTNPDRASPRAGGVTVASPGALAHDYAQAGGRVIFYGKPHRLVFAAVALALDVAPARLLMVGDSFEHDIDGAASAGWSTAFVEGGLHAAAFADPADPLQTVQALCSTQGCSLPNFTLPTLR